MPRYSKFPWCLSPVCSPTYFYQCRFARYWWLWMPFHFLLSHHSLLSFLCPHAFRGSSLEARKGKEINFPWETYSAPNKGLKKRNSKHFLLFIFNFIFFLLCSCSEKINICALQASLYLVIFWHVALWACQACRSLEQSKVVGAFVLQNEWMFTGLGRKGYVM